MECKLTPFPHFLPASVLKAYTKENNPTIPSIALNPLVIPAATTTKFFKATNSLSSIGYISNEGSCFGDEN